MVDTVYCTIHVRSMQAKCIMILYVTLNQDNELGPTRILRIYTQLPMYCIHCVQFTLPVCMLHIRGVFLQFLRDWGQNQIFWRQEAS